MRAEAKPCLGNHQLDRGLHGLQRPWIGAGVWLSFWKTVEAYSYCPTCYSRVMTGGFSWCWTMPSISSLEKCLGHRTGKSWISIAKMMKDKLPDLLMTWHASGCRAAEMDH